MQKDLDGYLETYNAPQAPPRPRHGGQDALRGLRGRDPEEAAHPQTLSQKGGQDRSLELTSRRPGVR